MKFQLAEKTAPPAGFADGWPGAAAKTLPPLAVSSPYANVVYSKESKTKSKEQAASTTLFRTKESQAPKKALWNVYN